MISSNLDCELACDSLSVAAPDYPVCLFHLPPAGGDDEYASLFHRSVFGHRLGIFPLVLATTRVTAHALGASLPFDA